MDTVPLCSSSAKSPVDPAQLYVEHRSFVRTVLLSKGIAEREVEDLVQDVFVVVMERIGDLATGHAPRPWLYVIARNVGLNYRRLDRVRRERLPGDLPDEPFAELDVTVEEAFSSHEIRGQVRLRISNLRPKLRVVLEAHALEGRPMPEIAALLGIPLKTAYARLTLSRRALARSSVSLRAA